MNETARERAFGAAWMAGPSPAKTAETPRESPIAPFHREHQIKR
jgi:hypothetical protein